MHSQEAFDQVEFLTLTNTWIYLALKNLHVHVQYLPYYYMYTVTD